MLWERKGTIPSQFRKVKRTSKRLTRENGEPIEKSLVAPVIESDFNDFEKKVALCLDSNEKLLWWYRNIVKADFYIQGWKKNKIYPDYITADKSNSNPEKHNNFYILETKGEHLLGNEDTRYKESIFKLCNELGRKTNWNELGLEFDDNRVTFHLIPENEWKNKINAIFHQEGQ